MQRLIWLAILIGASYILHSGWSSPKGPADFAGADPSVVTYRQTMIIYMANWLGLEQLTSQDLSLLTLISVVYCLVIGWTAQFVLKDRGFGTGIDGLLAFLGCFIGVFFYGRIVGHFDKSKITALVLIAVATSISTLLVAALAKAWVLNEVDDHLSGARPAKSRDRNGNAVAAADRFNKIAGRKH